MENNKSSSKTQSSSVKTSRSQQVFRGKPFSQSVQTKVQVIKNETNRNLQSNKTQHLQPKFSLSPRPTQRAQIRGLKKEESTFRSSLRSDYKTPISLKKVIEQNTIKKQSQRINNQLSKSQRLNETSFSLSVKKLDARRQSLSQQIMQKQAKIKPLSQNVVQRLQQIKKEEYKQLPIPRGFQLLNTFYVGPGNNCELVIRTLISKGLTQELDKNKQVKVRWILQPYGIDYENLWTGMLANHVPELYKFFTWKSNLHHILVQGGAAWMQPKTFQLTNRKETESFLNDTKGGIWLWKPPDLSQGKGIKVYKNVVDLQKEVKNKQLKRGIVQRYLENPLLIQENKFDIRCYALVAHCKPLIAFWYPQYYIRRSLEKFDLQSDNYMVHLTNNSIQKKHEQFDAMKEETIWSKEQFSNYIQGDLIRKIDEQIFNQIKTLFTVTKNHIRQKAGCFELLGLDFMISKDNKVWFIEANTNPALWQDTTVQQSLIEKMLSDLVDLVFHLNLDNGIGKELKGNLFQQVYPWLFYTLIKYFKFFKQAHYTIELDNSYFLIILNKYKQQKSNCIQGNILENIPIHNFGAQAINQYTIELLNIPNIFMRFSQCLLIIQLFISQHKFPYQLPIKVRIQLLNISECLENKLKEAKSYYKILKLPSLLKLMKEYKKHKVNVVLIGILLVFYFYLIE